MKTAAINNTNPNFSGIRVKQNTLTKTFYSAILSASLLGASMNAADSFSKTKDKQEPKTEIVNNTNKVRHADSELERTGRMISRKINKSFHQNEDSLFGKIVLGAIVLFLALYYSEKN